MGGFVLVVWFSILICCWLQHFMLCGLDSVCVLLFFGFGCFIRIFLPMLVIYYFFILVLGYCVLYWFNGLVSSIDLLFVSSR